MAMNESPSSIRNQMLDIDSICCCLVFGHNHAHLQTNCAYPPNFVLKLVMSLSRHCRCLGFADPNATTASKTSETPGEGDGQRHVEN